MRNVFLFLALTVLTACSSAQKSNDLPTIGDGAYQNILETFTQASKKYEGFYNTFDLHATILNSAVQNAQLKRKGEYLQWDKSTAEHEREKIYQEMSSAAKFFLSFYSPEADYNNLHKPDSVWKIYLDVDGKRLEGKIRKISDNNASLQNIYPYHNRFSTAYEITFLTPMSSLENKPCTFVLTGSAATATLQFPAVSKAPDSGP